MATSTFGDFFANIDGIIQSVFTTAATGMSNYILPVGWTMFAISVLVWSLLVMQGKIESPMSDWVLKGMLVIIILSAAGSYYSSWISGPLFQLPNDLSAAIGNSGTPASVLDGLDNQFEGLIMGIAAAMVDNITSLNIGGAVILFVALVLVAVAGTLLLFAAAYNILYAKFALGMVLGVGPFFVVWLMWKQTQQWFWSWLNTALYYVFLIVIASLFITMFVQVVSNYMTHLETAVTGLASSPADAGLATKIAGMLKTQLLGPSPAQAQAGLNILSIAFQLIFVCVPLFFIEIQLPTMVASMTGGSGGSAGSGGMMVMQAVRTAAAVAAASKKGK